MGSFSTGQARPCTSMVDGRHRPGINHRHIKNPDKVRFVNMRPILQVFMGLVNRKKLVLTGKYEVNFKEIIRVIFLNPKIELY